MREDLLKKSKIPKHMTMILSWYDICHIMLFFVMTRQQLNVVLYLMPQLVKRTVFRLMIVFYLVPALQPNLVSVLLRFRTHKIGLMADIEKMFLQIKLAEKDRDVHRYVWRDMQIDGFPTIYQMTRVAFGVKRL
jgi:hypothetical protein